MRLRTILFRIIMYTCNVLLFTSAMLTTVSAQGERIVGGYDALPNAWPSTAALMWNQNQRCGGSLIDPNWVLTAAHCVDGSNLPDSVVLGRLDLRNSDGENIKINDIIIHPDFNRNTLDNDIALIHLSNPSIQEPASLIFKDKMQALNSGNVLTVVGWGYLLEGGSSSDVLQQVDVEFISQSICNASDWYDGAVTNNQFCAGIDIGGKDSCQGDSGGPIFTQVNGASVQTGIVSWGRGCARSKKPGVYTRIANYLSWINSVKDRYNKHLTHLCQVVINNSYRSACYKFLFQLCHYVLLLNIINSIRYNGFMI